MTFFHLLTCSIGRMFKLIQSASGLRTLFNTLISSMPAMANVGSLMLLVLFIYAVLGMNLYGGFGNPFDEAGTEESFNNVASALMVLVQVGLPKFIQGNKGPKY